jgi:ABC-type Fe3+ transport system permease subunit
MPNQEESGLRGTATSVILGLLAGALGGMCSAAASSASDNRQLLSGLGMFLLVIGGLMFGIGVLVELFSIRPALAKMNQALASLYKDPSTHADNRPGPEKKLSRQ